MASNNTPSVDELRRLLGKTAEPVEKAPIATLTKGKDGKIDVTEEVLEALSEPIFQRSSDKLKPVLIQTIADGLKQESETFQSENKKFQTDLEKSIRSEQEKVKSAQEQLSHDLLALATQVRPIEVRTELASVPMTGVSHHKFELLLRIIGAGLPVFMVGPAGTGKTAGAEKAATALGLDFYAMSVGSQTSKSDIFGYKDATGAYHTTPFREAYEKGGVFLLDEADAGNANVLVGLNAALSNGYVFFPDGKMTKMSENFRMVATANTFGNGASRQYVGRNQLDAATLDRFTVVTWDIDAQIEEAISDISPTYGKRWLNVVRAVRTEAIDKLELRAVVSPRATLRGATLLESGVEYEDVVQVALIANLPEAEREALRNIADTEWAKETKRRGRPLGSTNKPKSDLDEMVSVFESAETLDEDS